MTQAMAIREEVLPEQPSQAVTAVQFKAAMEEGRQKAAILKDIVEQQGLFVNIQGRKYLEVEAWQIIAEGYGYATRIAWCREIEDGGWEARCEVLDALGSVVGAAEAECGTKGDRPWDSRARYQQRSMAQTRAVSKALRSRLSWVITLAGYAATPADEMPRDAAPRQQQRQAPRQQAPAPKPAPAPAQPAMSVDEATGEILDAAAAAGERTEQRETPRPTDKQLTRLWAIAGSAGIDEEKVHEYIRKAWGWESVKDLDLEQYDLICSQMERKAAATTP